MGWIGIIIRVIPTIISLMAIAEDLFDDTPDSGADKKKMVTAAVKALIQGISGFTGDEALWKKIDKAIGLLIDTACIFLFPHDDEVEG